MATHIKNNFEYHNNWWYSLSMLAVNANMRNIFKRLRYSALSPRTVGSAVAFAIAVYGSTAAFSQIRTPNDEKLSIKTRVNEAYDPNGIRLGSFVLSPSITNTLRYTDNVYATDINKVHDFIYEVKPGVNIKSDFVRHEISAGFSAQRGLYRDITDENYTDYSAKLAGRLDITGDTSLPLSASYDRSHYRRGSLDDTDSTKPTVFDLYQASAGLVHSGQRLAMKAIANFKRFIFENDRTNTRFIDNRDRDRDEYSLYSSIGMPEEGYFAPFVYSNLKKIEYDLDFDQNGLNRDSDEYELGFGSIINFSDITKAAFNIGYLNRAFDDNNLDDINDLTYGVNFSWEPSSLMMIVLEGNRTTRETFDTLSSASIATDLRLSVDYELFPNVFLNPNMGFVEQDYEGIDKVITQYNAGLTGTYKINQNFWLSMTYKYITQDEDGEDIDGTDSYDSNSYGLSLKMQF